MHVQQRSASGVGTLPERPLHVLEVVELPGTIEIYDQVLTGVANALALRVRVLHSIARYTRSCMQIFLLGGA
jgi:hypothetical protein